MVDLYALLDLPDISFPKHDLGSAKQQTAHYIRLPSIPGASVEKYFSPYRQEMAMQEAIATGIAFAEDRERAKIMRAKARAEARLAQAYAEGRMR